MQNLAGGGECADLGVVADVVAGHAGVVRGGNDVAFVHHHRAHRNFAHRRRLRRLCQRSAHKVFHFGLRRKHGHGRMGAHGFEQGGFFGCAQSLRHGVLDQCGELPQGAAGEGEPGGFEQQKAFGRALRTQIGQRGDAELF